MEVEEKGELGNITKRKKIGVEAPKEIVWKKENPISAIPKSIENTYVMTQTMLRGIYHMIKGDISTKEIGGPIAILQLTGKQAKNGIWSLALFVAFISINLGILNLLPYPFSTEVISYSILLKSLQEGRYRKKLSISRRR